MHAKASSGQCKFSSARFLERLFTQIQRPLYEEAMLVPIRMGTIKAAVNQTKKTSLSLETKREFISPRTNKH